MENELISIIVPVYNVENYIGRCLDSLMEQTYKNIEIIVIDDGSPDSSGKIAEEYAKKDIRIKVIHKTNGGLSDARNRGIDVAKGSYLTFIDSDDFVAKDYLEYLYCLVKKYNVDMASVFYQIVSSEEDVVMDKKNTEYLLNSKEAIEKMLYREQLSHVACGKLFHKKLFQNQPKLELDSYYKNKELNPFYPIQNNKYRFPVGIINEDLALIYYMVMECGTVVQGTKRLYYYYNNVDSITKSRVKVNDFTVFDLYDTVSKVILHEYPDLSDAVLELKATIYVKLYKRILLKQKKDFLNQQQEIEQEIKLMKKGLIKKKIRKPTKIRLYFAALSKRLFIALCNIENVLGAKS